MEPNEKIIEAFEKIRKAAEEENATALADLNDALRLDEKEIEAHEDGHLYLSVEKVVLGGWKRDFFMLKFHKALRRAFIDGTAQDLLILFLSVEKMDTVDKLRKAFFRKAVADETAEYLAPHINLAVVQEMLRTRKHDQS